MKHATTKQRLVYYLLQNIILICLHDVDIKKLTVRH